VEFGCWFFILVNISIPDRSRTCSLQGLNLLCLPFHHGDILSFRLDSNQRDLSVPDYKSGTINLYATEACLHYHFGHIGRTAVPTLFKEVVGGVSHRVMIMYCTPRGTRTLKILCLKQACLPFHHRGNCCTSNRTRTYIKTLEVSYSIP
jgi:hypothetical protein